MSTSDCKTLLVEAYPTTNAKAWKRVSKFKNIHNEDIRLFSHHEVGQVWVDEEEGTLSTDPDDILNAQASTLKASDFYVAFESHLENGVQVCSSLMAVYKPYFDKHGCFDSIHLGRVMERLYPQGLICEEDSEASFCISQDFPLADLQQMFRAAGFLESDAAQKMFE